MNMTTGVGATRPKDPRKEALKELVNEERSYCGQIRFLVKEVLLPLQDLARKNAGSLLAGMIFKNHVTMEQLLLMFDGFPELLEVHQAFLSDLERCLDKFTPSLSLADPFDDLIRKLDIYIGLCDRMYIAVEEYKDMRDNKKEFRKFIEALPAKNHEFQTDLVAFSRLPREQFKVYVKHIKAIHRATDKETELGNIERDKLRNAGKRIEDIDSEVGQSMRTPEEARDMIDIQLKLDVNIHKQFRICHKFGILQKISRKAIQKRFYVLFSDILIYAKMPSIGSVNAVKGQLDMGTTWIQDALDTQRMRNAFQIVSKDKTYIVMAETKDEKVAWMTAMQRVIDNLVAHDPALKEQRAKAKIQDASGIFKLFTLSSSDMAIDPNVEVAAEKEKEKEKEVAGATFDAHQMAMGAMIVATQNRPDRVLIPIQKSKSMLAEEEEEEKQRIANATAADSDSD